MPTPYGKYYNKIWRFASKMTHITRYNWALQLIAWFYKTAARREPVRKWLLELSADDRRIIG